MKKWYLLCLLLIYGLCFIPAACFSQECVMGETQGCFCPDNTTSVQSCRSDGSGWEQCDCTYHTIWCDGTTGLCWQDPQKDAYTEGDIGLVSQEAPRYCNELVFGGYDDWRLANINELRTLIKGCPDSEPGGACPLVEGSPFAHGQDENCLGCEEFAGPGVGGCYWKDELTGTCNKPDPAAAGHPLETWATNPASDNPDWISCVLFDSGAVTFNHLCSYGDVRCVRDAPSPPITCEDPTACTPGTTRQCACPGNDVMGSQVCASDGSCWGPCECTGFVQDIGECEIDVSPESDKVILTISVPEPLAHPPSQLIAFWYSADDWTFPPNRPPDGGTDYNQVINPDIDYGNPYVMTVPGCTYYREDFLEGDYYLFVGLLMEENPLPIPGQGDYWWGMDQTPTAFPFNGVEHQATEIEMEVTLVSVDESLSSIINIGSQWANCGDVGVKIHICLQNLEVSVGGFQMDLCETIGDCLECTECELTERTTMFDCVINELENGCCRVILFSKHPSGLINPGECDIVTIVYKLKDEPQCCNTCIDINGENIFVTDEYGYLLESMVGDLGSICPWRCGDIEPPESAPGTGDCGDRDADIFDILEEVGFAVGTDTPDGCQIVRADVPTGTPPGCLAPDGSINILDVMVIIDMALNRQDCCSYYYGGTIY